MSLALTAAEKRGRRKARDAARASGIDLAEYVRLLLRQPTWTGGSRVPRKERSRG